MATTAYDIGDRQRFTVTFTDLNGTNTDPSSVVCTIIEPDGTENTPTPTNSAPGIYYADFTITQSGRHFVRWTGTGALVAAGNTEFYGLPNEG